MGNSGGSGVGNSEKTGPGDGGGVGSDGGSGVVSGVGGGGVVTGIGGGGGVGKSIIAHSDVRLADGGEWGVNGLGVGGHLSQVAVAPEGVLVLGGDGGGGHSHRGVSVGYSSGCGITSVVGDGGGSAEVSSVGNSQAGSEDNKLRKEDER
ncbi:hypothetical protein J437_LFUL018280 [Ladona fulva]|uniref:Uncharacterized protein n=1 Tax=Ladona fulva TaxID=123851 RepID=A0A8K0KN57_LADFU|nr:hypothetical protein J437_LFUL018280 [Ladona fulva]